MRFSQRTWAMAAAVGLLAGSTAFAGQTPAPAAPRKLIAPQRGEATVEITKPNTKVVGGDVLTMIMVRNTSPAPIAGFKVEENWYDKTNQPVGGDLYRHPRPLMPNEVITINLKTPKNAKMSSNQYNFTHANGAVKPKVVPKIVATPTT